MATTLYFKIATLYECICSERALTLCLVGISLGGRQDMFTKRLVDSVVRQRVGCCDVLVRCQG